MHFLIYAISMGVVHNHDVPFPGLLIRPCLTFGTYFINVSHTACENVSPGAQEAKPCLRENNP